MSKVVEKTKTMSENVITTLDPQMKEFIKSGGDIEVVVASDKEGKVGPVREAFQEVFGQATVYGLASKAASMIAREAKLNSGLPGGQTRAAPRRAEHGSMTMVSREAQLDQRAVEKQHGSARMRKPDCPEGRALQHVHSADGEA